MYLQIKLAVSSVYLIHMQNTFIYPHDLLSSVEVNRHKTAINRLGWLKSGRLLSASMRLSLSILCDERMWCESEYCGYNHAGDASTTTHSTPLKVNQIRLPPGASAPHSPGQETWKHIELDCDGMKPAAL